MRFAFVLAQPLHEEHKDLRAFVYIASHNPRSPKGRPSIAHGCDDAIDPIFDIGHLDLAQRRVNLG